ncbi:MAG: hypothetical protein WDZ60_09420, partial [Wenzhouxiangellaceae bacterium]
MNNAGLHDPHQIDALLARHGVYRPIDLLVALRRLPEASLRDWKSDPALVLEDILLGDPDRWIEALKSAADWAEKLGLERQLRPATAADGQPLRASRKPWLQQLLLTEYRRPDTGPQLDLFIDNPQTVARNRLIRALRSNNVGSALEALGQFSQAGAGHDDLSAAETLVDALNWPGDGELEPATGLEFLEQQLVPAARRLLDRSADAWLAPYWNRLADAMDPRKFDPDQPKLHPGWPARQAGNWARAIEACMAVPDLARQPILLHRLADAGIALGDRMLAIGALAELCWHDPRAAETWLRDCRDPGIEARRDQFWDLEPELETALFPAWLALFLPTPDPMGQASSGQTAKACQTYNTARALHKKQGDPERRIALRECAPELLEHWL